MTACRPPRPTDPTGGARARWSLACCLATFIALSACGGSGSSEAATPSAGGAAPTGTGPAAPAPASAPAPAPAPAPWGTAKASARVFISGHSLTDNPLGDHLVQIANSLGGASAARYNQQIVIGSPIRVRTDQPANWAGYSQGKNRDSSGMNVINELRSPATLGAGERYDTLVIAENHNSVSMLQWENTVRYLRHFHERLLAGNPQGRTYFYETWFDIAGDVTSTKADPRAWIAHERGASKAWQCMVVRVNHSLAAEGRPDRLTPLPAGAALAELVERATQGNVAGITAGSATDTVNRLFRDNVHLTTTGMYYMALVTYSAVYQRSPVGAWAPSGVSSTAARSLQELAWSYVSNFYAGYQAPTLDSCRADFVQNYCPLFWSYRNRAADAPGSCRTFSTQDANTNPLYYNAATDASYWFPAP